MTETGRGVRETWKKERLTSISLWSIEAFEAFFVRRSRDLWEPDGLQHMKVLQSLLQHDEAAAGGGGGENNSSRIIRGLT